jgi:D-glycero-D-manno-heptose 1,7-bisphosphate phosphatase
MAFSQTFLAVGIQAVSMLRTIPAGQPVPTITARAIFLDRDGVLIRSDVVNGKPIAVQQSDRMEVLPGVEDACRSLHQAGFLLVVVTNQPDVGRGLASRATVDEINRNLKDILVLDDVRVCCHDGKEACTCRKPAPGMLTDAAAEYGIDLAASFMVGDRWRDIEAGNRAGCRTVYIEWGHGEALTIAPDHTARSLLEAVPWILETARNSTSTN